MSIAIRPLLAALPTGLATAVAALETALDPAAQLAVMRASPEASASTGDFELDVGGRSQALGVKAVLPRDPGGPVGALLQTTSRRGAAPLDLRRIVDREPRDVEVAPAAPSASAATAGLPAASLAPQGQRLTATEHRAAGLQPPAQSPGAQVPRIDRPRGSR